MVDTSTIVSIVIAIVSLLGTLIVAAMTILDTERRERRAEARKLKGLTAMYCQPLLVASHALGKRLYELLEFPISKQHLETKEGIEDIKVYTCYRFAVFLAWTHILETKTQYFSFSEDKTLELIVEVIFRLHEEFDRRRDEHGQNVGVWPGFRILVAERMLKSAKREEEVPLDTMVIGYDEFREDWEKKFKVPMGYFGQWIDDMVLGRRDRVQGWDGAMRNTQHNLYDMLKALNAEGRHHFADMKRAGPDGDCDCSTCRPDDDRQKMLSRRETSRNWDKGLRPFYVKPPINREWAIVDSAYDSSISLEGIKQETCTDFFDQGERVK